MESLCRLVVAYCTCVSQPLVAWAENKRNEFRKDIADAKESLNIVVEAKQCVNR